MADNVTLGFHNMVNSASLPHLLAVSPNTSDGPGRIGRTLSSAYSYNRRPNNSFESLNSSSSEYEYDWSSMEQVLQERMKINEAADEIIEDTKLHKTPSYDKDLDDEEDEAVSLTTQHEVEWFQSVGLGPLVAKILDDTNGEAEDIELATHLTKSQSDTVRRRLASLQGTLSKASSQQIAEALSRSTTSSDLAIGPLTSDVEPAPVEPAARKPIKQQWRDVRDVFTATQRRSSSSSESHDGDRELSPKSSAVDSPDIGKRLSEIYPENYHPEIAYSLTSSDRPLPKKSPPHRWRAQQAADIVGHDQETGVKTTRIVHYRTDSVVELEQPPPIVWPKSASASPDSGGRGKVPTGQDIQLEFAYKLHPAGSLDSNWPTVVARGDAAGITQIDDLLWEGDVQSVKQLALIEVTRIYDDHLLTVSKRRLKPKKKIKTSPETGVFGSSLERLVVLDNNRRGSSMLISTHTLPNVPIVFQQMLTYMEECGGVSEEGVLRICGETNRMRRLCGELDSYYSNPVPDDSSITVDDTAWFRRVFQSASIHDIASVMKQFLRDLPQPLLTNELVDAFAQISEIPDRITQIYALNLLVVQLPPAERATLKALLSFLRKIADAEKSNKMSSGNIALIIAPNLFHPKIKTVKPPSPQGFLASNISLSSNSSNGKRDDPSRTFDAVSRLAEITRTMIVYSPFLFTLPPSFLRQIRSAYDAEATKAPKKAKDKRLSSRLDPRKMRQSKPKPTKTLPVLPESDKTNSTFFQQQFPNETIRVRLGRRSSNDKVSTAVQVTPGLSAGDVVAKFLPNNSLASSPEISSSTEPLNLSTSSGVSDKSSSSSNEDLLEIGRVVGSIGSDRREAEPPVSLATHFLVEQGGNIGLRRLDHNASMMASFRANPEAVWIVKYFPSF